MTQAAAPSTAAAPAQCPFHHGASPSRADSSNASTIPIATASPCSQLP